MPRSQPSRIATDSICVGLAISFTKKSKYGLYIYFQRLLGKQKLCSWAISPCYMETTLLVKHARLWHRGRFRQRHTSISTFKNQTTCNVLFSRLSSSSHNKSWANFYWRLFCISACGTKRRQGYPLEFWIQEAQRWDAGCCSNAMFETQMASCLRSSTSGNWGSPCWLILCLGTVIDFHETIRAQKLEIPRHRLQTGWVYKPQSRCLIRRISLQLWFYPVHKQDTAKLC